MRQSQLANLKEKNVFTFEMFFAKFGEYATIVNGYSPKGYQTVSNVRYPRNPAFIVFSDGSGHFAENRFNFILRKYEDFSFGHFQNWKEAYDQITERFETARERVAYENMLD